MFPLSRRAFVTRSLQAGTVAALGDFAFLQGLRPVTAEEVKVPADKVRLASSRSLPGASMTASATSNSSPP
jgi:hypothetical protein